MSNNLTFPVYYNKVDELIPFNDLETAFQWLSDLDTSGTPILVPFKNEFNQIQFLKPGIRKYENHMLVNKNENLRIMGAANEIEKTFMDKVTGLFNHHHVPHLNNVKGEIIKVAEHGFIVIYERGEENAGKKFDKLFQEEKNDLLTKIEVSQTNEGPCLNNAKFIQDLSKLAMDLDIKSGMCYFLINKEDGTHIYRHTFKQDPINKKIEAYLHKENDWHKSAHKIIENNKSQNHHIVGFLKDWLKWTAFAALTGIGAGLLLGFFLPATLGTIVAALVAVVTFIGTSSYGFYRADLNNSTTIEFNNTEFMTESENTFSCRIKKRFNSLQVFLNRKLTNTSDFCNGSNVNNLARNETAEVVSSSNISSKPKELLSANTHGFFPEAAPTEKNELNNSSSFENAIKNTV